MEQEEELQELPEVHPVLQRAQLLGLGVQKVELEVILKRLIARFLAHFLKAAD